MEGIFVLSSWTLSESIIFASKEGVGRAILLIIDPRNHGLSHCLYSIQKQGCRNPYSLKWGCWNLPFIHMVVVGVPPFLILVHFFKISPNFVYNLFRPRHVVSTLFWLHFDDVKCFIVITSSQYWQKLQLFIAKYNFTNCSLSSWDMS